MRSNVIFYLSYSREINLALYHFVKNLGIEVKTCRIVSKWEKEFDNHFVLELKCNVKKINEIEEIVEKNFNSFYTTKTHFYDDVIFNFKITEDQFMKHNLIKSIKCLKKYNL